MLYCRLAEKNGPSFVNTPYGSGQSFFREAFRNGDQEVVKCCVAHAEKNGILLDVGNVPCFEDVKEEEVGPPSYNVIVRKSPIVSVLRTNRFSHQEKLKEFWLRCLSIIPTNNDQSRREASSDILMMALKEKSKERVKEAVELICSPTTPFRSAAWLMKKYYKQLWKEYPEVIMNILFYTPVFFETCQPRVYDDLLNLASWKNKALHQGTSDTVSNWEFIDFPDRLDKRQELRIQKNIVGEEHKDDKALCQSTSNTISNGELIDIPNHPDRRQELRIRQTAGREEREEDHRATAQASLKFLRIEDAARHGMNGIIRPLLMRNAPVEIFRSKAIKAVTQYKWLTYWRNGFRWYVGYYALFLVVFTAYSSLVARSSAVCEGNHSIDRLKHCCLALMVAFGLKMLYEEVSQLCTLMEDGRVHLHSRMKGAAYFFKSKWNWLDLASCIILLLFIPTLHISACLTAGSMPKSFDNTQETLVVC